MRATTPSLAPAIEAVKRFTAEKSQVLTPEHAEKLREVIRRLERMAAQAEELTIINNKLMEANEIASHFDPNTGILVFGSEGAEIRVHISRADPNVPVKIEDIASGGSYSDHASVDVPLGEDENILLAFESNIESYYYSAHRVLHLLKSIPGLKGIDCRQIKIIRNKLIEHSNKGELYSFGFDANGPRVKPMHNGPSQWHDNGLTQNTVDFVQSIVSQMTLQPK